jgi:hypothetical protein
MFTKMFGGTFEHLKSFRRQLKRGAPDSIFAIFGFLIISLLFTIATVFIASCIFEDTQVVKHIGIGAMLTSCVVFVYNVIKAAWECFVAERQEVFDLLRKS